MSERIGERHASDCRYKTSDVPEGSRHSAHRTLFWPCVIIRAGHLAIERERIEWSARWAYGACVGPCPWPAGIVITHLLKKEKKHRVFNGRCHQVLKTTVEHTSLALAPPGFTPGKPRFGNYSGNRLGASSPPGFTPGGRGFEISPGQVVKPRLYRRKAQWRGLSERHGASHR